MEIIVYKFPMTVRYRTYNPFPPFKGSCKHRDDSLHMNLAKVSPDKFPLVHEPTSYFVSEVTSFGSGTIEVWTIENLGGKL